MITAPPRPSVQFCIDMMLRAGSILDYDRWAQTLRDLCYPEEIQRLFRSKEYRLRCRAAQRAKHANRAVAASMGQTASATNLGGS